MKPYIDINTELKTEAKNDFEKDFFKLMNNTVFGRTMESVRKHRDIKLITTGKRRNKLASEPNYHTTIYFSENVLAVEIKKTKVKMNKPVYLGYPVYLIHIKTKDFYEDIANDVELWFESSNYDDDVDIPIPIGKNKKKIVFFKEELRLC